MNHSAAGMPQPEGIVNVTGQSNTNPTGRNSRNERSNKGRRRRAAAEQRIIDQQRWGHYNTNGNEDSAPVVPATAPRSTNRRRARRNHRNNSTHHLEDNDYYYENDSAFHAVRPRNEICDDLELEMALSLSLSLVDPTSNSRNSDYNDQSVINMSYETLVQLESVKCVAPVNVVSSMLDITFDGNKKSEQRFPNEEEKCAICQCEYAHHDHIMSLPCTHGFHNACVSEWLLNYSKLCPICKFDVTNEKFVDM